MQQACHLLPAPGLVYWHHNGLWYIASLCAPVSLHVLSLSLPILRARTSVHPRIHMVIIDMSQSRMGVARSKILCIYYRWCEVFIDRYHVGLASETMFKCDLPTRFLREKKGQGSIENRYQLQCDIFTSLDIFISHEIRKADREYNLSSSWSNINLVIAMWMLYVEYIRIYINFYDILRRC